MRALSPAETETRDRTELTVDVRACRATITVMKTDVSGKDLLLVLDELGACRSAREWVRANQDKTARTLLVRSLRSRTDWLEWLARRVMHAEVMASKCTCHSPSDGCLNWVTETRPMQEASQEILAIAIQRMADQIRGREARKRSEASARYRKRANRAQEAARLARVRKRIAKALDAKRKTKRR